MLRFRPRSRPLRLVVVVMLWLAAVMKPALVLACDVEDARLALAAAEPLDTACSATPDPDADVDQLAHCCGHLVPLVDMPRSAVVHVTPGAPADEECVAPRDAPRLPLLRPPRPAHA
jgi:hypothetical protein